MLVTDNNDYPRAYGVQEHMHYIVPSEGARPVWVWATPWHYTISIYQPSTQYLREDELTRTPLIPETPPLERMALPEAFRQQFNHWWERRANAGD